MAMEEDNVCEKFEAEWKNRKIDGETNLLALFECSICREVANPPIFVCGECHMLCGDCRSSIKRCPKCTSMVSNMRCSFAEKVMSEFSLKCKFDEDGCKAYINVIDFRKHILKCPQRPIVCFVTKCGGRIPFKKFFSHLTALHEEKVNGVLNSNKHNIEWWIEGDPTKTARWPPYYLTCFDNVFLYMAISTVHGSWEWAWIIGSEEEAKRFRVRSCVRNDEKVVSLQWTGAVHSIRKSIQEIVSSGIVFVTNTKELQNPYLFHKNEEESRHFWHTNVEIIQIAPPPPGFVPYINTEDAGIMSLPASTFTLEVENTGLKTPNSKKQDSKMMDVDYTIPKNPPKNIILPEENDKVGSVTTVVADKTSAKSVPDTNQSQTKTPNNPVDPKDIPKEISKETQEIPKEISKPQEINKTESSVSMKIEVTSSKGGKTESQTFQFKPSSGTSTMLPTAISNSAPIDNDEIDRKNVVPQILYQNPINNTTSQPASNMNFSVHPSNTTNTNSQPILLIQVGVSPMQMIDSNALIGALSHTIQPQSQQSSSTSSTVRQGEPPYYVKENTK